MKKYGKALTNLIIALAGLVVVLMVLPRLLVFFAPFVAGWMIAWIAGPVVHFFEKRWKIKRKAGSAVVIVMVIALVVLLLYFACGKLVQEAEGLAEALPDVWEGLEKDFAELSLKLAGVYEKLPENMQLGMSNIGDQIGAYLGDAVGNISMPTIEAVGNFAKQVPLVFIGVIMALLSAYFFVADREKIGMWFRTFVPKNVQETYDMLRRSLVKAVGGYLKAQLHIEIWMYLLLVIGLSVLQVQYVLLIALLIAFLDLLPFFGTGTVMVPWAIVKMFNADYKMAVGLLIIWGVGQLVRQLIQPKIVGDSIGMAPLPTLFLLYIGYRFGGVFGMIVAVPLGLIVLSLYKEGAFDTTRDSFLILVNGVNRFRRLGADDLKEIDRKNRTEK